MPTLILRQVGETAVEMAGGEGDAAWTVRVDVPGEGGTPTGPKPTELFAFSLAGPLVMAALFREVFGSVGEDAPDLEAFAIQHARALLRGVLTSERGIHSGANAPHSRP